MKIENSVVAMKSEHSLESEFKYESVSIIGKKDEGIGKKLAELNEKSGQSAVADLNSIAEEREKEGAKAQKQAQAAAMKSMLERMRAGNRKNANYDINAHRDSKLDMLRRMLSALNHKGKKIELKPSGETAVDLRSSSFDMKEFFASYSGTAAVFAGSAAAGTDPGAGSLWTKTTAVSTSYVETESTSFSTVGVAQTADGRTINFNVELEMSRSFASEFNYISEEKYVLTDPLVINLDSNITSVSDFKVEFDLDGDGTTENISFAGEGSGFLALDKNGDGVINDGSELFGTRSGNGFKDLAAYDDDGNGWIDEGDDVFSRLKIWTRDEEGKDSLISLKDAGVGAIYLGSASTDFTLKGEDNVTNAVLRRTGIYLKENGNVGTVAHVDIASKP